MGEMTSDSTNAGAGIDLSQFYQVFFEEAGENLERMEQLLLEVDIAAADDEELSLLEANRLLLERVEPDEVVYLDDLGVNLKPAREMGMTTIKVGDPHAALAELHSALDARPRRP